MTKISKEKLAEICHARDILCAYCNKYESDNCKNCQINNLTNDAHNKTEPPPKILYPLVL